MAADRRLFDSSSLVTPPAPEIDAVTNTRELTPEEQKAAEAIYWRYLFQDRLTMFPYEGPPRSFRDGN